MSAWVEWGEYRKSGGTAQLCADVAPRSVDKFVRRIRSEAEARGNVVGFVCVNGREYRAPVRSGGAS